MLKYWVRSCLFTSKFCMYCIDILLSILYDWKPKTSIFIFGRNKVFCFNSYEISLLWESKCVFNEISMPEFLFVDSA